MAPDRLLIEDYDSRVLVQQLMLTPDPHSQRMPVCRSHLQSTNTLARDGLRVSGRPIAPFTPSHNCNDFGWNYH